MKICVDPRSIFFLIGLLMFSVQNFGQEKVQQYNSNGLSTTIFTTAKGKITVYLPEYASNETISGTIYLEAFGNSDKKKAKNLIEIQEYTLHFGDETMSLLAEVFKLKAPEVDNTLQLLNSKGKTIAESTIKTNSESKIEIQGTFIPEYMVADEPAKIISNCDGNLENNRLIINRGNVPILAESESAIYFKAPANSNGVSQLEYVNNDEVLEASVNVLGLDLSVWRTDLLRGETTTLTINVSGLTGLETSVPITIANKSINNISLDGGNVQQLEISPSNDAPSGTYVNNISISALQRGSFSISVNIEPPEPNTSSILSDRFLCNCYINGRTYLISPSACEELGGHCSENRDEGLTDDYEDETPSNFEFELPEEIIIHKGSVTLKVNNLSDLDCIAVVFSYRSIDEEQWQHIGEDTTINNGLTLNWDSPADSEGVYEFRAQLVNTNNIISEQFGYAIFNTNTEVVGDISYSVTQDDVDRAYEKARATGKRIKEEKEKLEGLKDREWDAEDSKKKNETAKNELIAIDKVLDSIPKTYKDDLKRILDSLASLRKKTPDVIDHSALQKAIDDAQSRVDDCNKRLEALKMEQADLEKQRDDIKSQLDAVQEAIYKLHIDNGWVGDYGYHSDGRPWHGYVGGERANTDLGDEKYELKKQYRGLKKDYVKTLKRLGELPEEIAEAEEDCEELNMALEKAKSAKENADLHAATELEADDICRQIKRLLIHLRQWCSKNPSHCDFKDRIKELSKKCPKDSSELEAFWKEFNDIVSRKKELEDSFGDAAAVDQDAIDSIAEEIEKQKAKIKALKEQQDEDYAEAQRKSRQRAQEAAEAKAKADANERERNKQKKEDEKIKDLIKKARSDDAGEDALKDLAKGMGLDLLDEATGNLKLGKIIGGLLVAKNIPDCVCPLLKALKDAIAAHRRGEDPFVYVNDYILKWKKCANLPSISSIMEGSKQLTEAIQDMSKEQSLRAINALNQAIRVHCK